MRNIAIVTGASSGLGLNFTKLLDKGAGGPLDEIWLIARDQEALQKVAQGLSTPAKVLALDLCDKASFAAIDDALAAEQDLNVQWLFNCAGFGKFGPFTSIGATANGNMVRLNCLAVVELSYSCLLYMHAGSRIVNIASAAALVPQPGLSVYGATKRFVLDFSRALDRELGDAGIHVSAVCPKFMDTAFLDRPGDKDALATMEWIGFEDPATVCSKAIKDALRGKACIITSPDMRVANGLCKVLPCDLVMTLQGAVGRAWARHREGQGR
ncbi:SDR family NAD(P)-dependent oxidoreductase [Atopobiaceae bacterium 24-176]